MKSRPDSIGSDRIMGNLKHPNGIGTPRRATEASGIQEIKASRHQGPDLDGIGTGESGSLLRFDIKKLPDRISFE